MRLLSLLLPLLLFAAPASACVELEPCQLGERSYHVKPPDDWDGQRALPVLLHFHGWKRQGTLIVRHMRISGATRRRGVLLVAPNGRFGTWDFWDAGSPDAEFAAAVLEDVGRRYPIDRSRIYVSGYSYGSAMAWRFVCERGEGVRALLAVAGTLDQREDCVTLPAEVRHVHGRSDRVMDFPYGPGGDETHPVALWRRHFECGAAVEDGTWRATKHDLFTRYRWPDCAGGRRVILDVHDRGHFIPRGWIARQLDELMGAEG